MVETAVSCLSRKAAGTPGADFGSSRCNRILGHCVHVEHCVPFGPLRRPTGHGDGIDDARTRKLRKPIVALPALSSVTLVVALAPTKGRDEGEGAAPGVCDGHAARR